MTRAGCALLLCLTVQFALRVGAAPAHREATASVAPGVDPARISALGNTDRVIEISTWGLHDTVASARVYGRVGARWRQLRGPMSARLGYGGLSWPSRRHEGDGTTPIGDYGFVYGFGSLPDPGLQGFAWRRLAPGACWSQTPRDYNRWIERSPCPAADEDLWRSATGAYRYAAVIDFNYRRPVYPRGSGIFLHDRVAGPTAGCIALAEPGLLFVLRWIRPGTRILIAPYFWLRSLP